MGDKSKIEWTDATWNPIRGCSRVSEGCRNCYAERVAARFSWAGPADPRNGETFANGPYHGLATMTKDGPRWTGEVRFIEEHLRDPLRWKKPRRIFVNSMSDLFHEKVSDENIQRIFEVMAAASHHTFQVLTKRPDRMLHWFHWAYHVGFGGPGWPLKNVWLGVSVEDQKAADERIPDLLATPAAVRFISAEPLLDSVDLEKFFLRRPVASCGNIDWVIVGGESGPGARLMAPDLAIGLVDQCRTIGIPVFFKQWGGVNKSKAGRLLLGREWNEFPEVKSLA